MRPLSFVLFACFAHVTLAQALPPIPGDDDVLDAEEELRRLGSINGFWEGNVEHKLDAVGTTRTMPNGFPIRIEIDGKRVGIWVGRESGRLEPLAGDAALIFAQDGTALIDYVAIGDGFVETWSLSLNQVKPEKLSVFILRTVHNYGIAHTSPWRAFSVYSVAELERDSTN